MPGIHTFYDGSKILEPLANAVKFEVDKVNLVVCQLMSIVFAVFYYNYLPPLRTTKNIRLLFPCIIGISLCYFCYGSAIKHILANLAVCYALMKFSPSKYVHKLVFLFSMGYLIFIHWFRWYILSSYCIDVTGPIMVIVQKTTTLAFSLHDGLVKKPEELTELQKREAIKEVPTILNYLSFTLHFQTVLTGPLCFYTDYQKFITGENTLIDGKKYNVSPWRAVFKKMSVALICFCFIVKFAENSQPEKILQPEYFRLSCFKWILLFFWVIFMQRLQYYYAWVLADAICNLSGFGFCGFDKNGDEKWDLVTNVYPLKVEAALTFKDTLDAWNCTTMYWLRRVAYDRVPKNYRTISTYLLSALWHGFFVGYYVTFATGALFTVAARTVRRSMRHLFQSTKLSRFSYDVLTFMATKFALMYTTFPFVTMHLNPGLLLYKRLYFFLHILALVSVVVLPLFYTPLKPVSSETKCIVEERLDISLKVLQEIGNNVVNDEISLDNKKLK